jgi:hypothetical protein
MTQIICDKCRKPVLLDEKYYTLVGHFPLIGDSKIDVCEKCASLHSIDGKLIVGKELIFEESEVAE